MERENESAREQQSERESVIQGKRDKRDRDKIERQERVGLDLLSQTIEKSSNSISPYSH